MPVGSVVAIYIVAWWICLFAILPIGAHSQSDAGSIHPGSEPGAPALIRLWPKLLINSMVAALVTALLLWAVSNPTLQQYWS